MTRRPQKSKQRNLRSRKATKRAKPAQRSKPMRRAPDALDDFITAGARALDLTIDKAWMPAVRGHLEVTLRHGALVSAFALSDEAEPAPVFKA
jgi:1-carboxybiuret hydrolase subunit AtzG-like protein